MCYIELKNEKYETLEDLKRLLHYIFRLDKTAEDASPFWLKDNERHF